MSAFGKNSALQVPTALLQKSPGKGNVPPVVTRYAGALLNAAAKGEALDSPTLQLSAALLDQAPQQWLEPCLDLAAKGLRAADAETRVAAIQLVLRPSLRQDFELLAKVVPLLKDHVAQVRKTALLALGPARELVSDDDLLPLLHDRDEDARNLISYLLSPSSGVPGNVPPVGGRWGWDLVGRSHPNSRSGPPETGIRQPGRQRRGRPGLGPGTAAATTPPVPSRWRPVDAGGPGGGRSAAHH
jgi:hypothetical protein